MTAHPRAQRCSLFNILHVFNPFIEIKFYFYSVSLQMILKASKYIPCLYIKNRKYKRAI